MVAAQSMLALSLDHKRAVWLRAVQLLLLLMVHLFLPALGFAAGGDYLWPPYNLAAAGKQDAKASAVDSQGNLIIVGSTEAASSDFYVAKLKADGSGPLWSVSRDSIAGTDVATAVAIDSNDDVLVTGYLWNGGSYNDIYTAKYAAADGALLWQHTFDGTGHGHDYPTAIVVTDVAVYVGGYMQNPTTRDSFILLKYDPHTGPNPDGSPLWQIAYDAGNSGHDRIFALVADDLHGVAVTGESQNLTPDFDCLTIKYDLNGTLLWTRRYADSGDGRGQALAMDAAGNVLMAGSVNNGSNSDFYVVKYAGDDSPAHWDSRYDSGNDDHASAIWLDSADNVYVVGDDSTLTSGSDVHVARYHGGSGAEVWSNSYNSSGGHNDMGLHIVGDPAGELFVSGYTNDGVGGLDDILTLKIKKSDGVLLWSKAYDGATKRDRPVGAGLGPEGNLLIGGWSDRFTAGSSDYDFLALNYESGALDPPTALVAAVISNTQIDLVWSDNAVGEENFIIERKIGAFGSPVEIVLGPDVTSYSDTGLSADTRYFYRVKAYSAATGASPFSNEVNVKTTVVSEAAPLLHFEFGGAAAGDDFAQAIAVGPDNHPVVTGYVTGAGTDYDYYTIKLDRADLSVQWHASYNDDDNEGDVANALSIDSSNRVVVSGYSSLFGGGMAGNTNDIFTIGYPAHGGAAAWTDQYNGPDGDDDRSSAIASAVDASDHTVVVGYGKNHAFNDDIYVIKLRPDGSRAWAAIPYDGGGADYPAAVAFDAAGDILVGGRTHTGANLDFFVAKYSGSTGVRSWLKTFNGPGNGADYINALAVDAAGDLYVTGYSLNAAGNGDIYSIKYAGSDGTILWQHAYNGPGNGYDVGDSVQFDPVDGSILVGGTINIAPGNNDFHLIRYAADGTVVWQRTLDRPDSDEALVAMSIDRSGTVCLTGTTDAGGTDDVLTVKYDSNGMIIGASIYNGSANSQDVPTAITTNSYGETFVAGFTLNANGDADYLVFLADGVSMQSPTPFTANQQYTQIELFWTDNSLAESGFDLQRKAGTCSSGSPWLDLYQAPAGETSYVNTGVSIDSTFCYRIQSYNASGDASRWAELEVTTAAPLAPSGLTATVRDTSSVQLAWVDNTGNEDGFIIERCLGSGCDFTGSFTLHTAVAPTDAVSFTDDSACPGQSYSYRIKADRTNQWTTAYSNIVSDIVTNSPVAPSDFVLTLISEQQVDLSWTDNSSDETGFTIERCLTSDCSSPVVAGTVPADVVSFSDTGLAENTTYWYRVTPYKTMTCTTAVAAYSPILAMTTAPPPPGSVTAVPVSSTQINLSWVDGTSSETGFKIERCQGAGCTPVEIDSVAAAMTRYADRTVCAAGDYRYRVRAYSTAPWDSASNIVAVTLPVLPPPPDFNLTTLSEDQIKVDWSSSGYDLHGYLLERCVGTGCTPVPQLTVPDERVLALAMEDASWEEAGAVSDSSGRGNHATAYNSAAPVVAGKYHWGGNFPGTDGYIATPVSIDQSSSGPGATFETWVYPYSTDNNWRHLISTSSSGNEWSLARYGTQWRVYFGSSYWTIGTVTPDAWQHLMVVFEPGVGCRFYQNGVMYSTASIAYDTTTNPVTIGRRASGSYYFDGKLDEVMIYARALTHAEALARYNSGNSATATRATTYSESGLATGTTYGYRLKSYRDDNCADERLESNPTVTKYTATLSPQPPSGFTATTVNSTRIDLAWTDNTTTESGFILSRCPGSGSACDEESEFVTALATTAANAVSYVDLTVCYGQTYSYRIVATNPAGAPSWPTAGVISTSATTPSVATPVDFAATAISESEIDLDWTDNLLDEEAYTLRQCVGSGTACDEESEFSLLIDFANRQSLTEATLWLKIQEASWGTVVNSASGGLNPYRYQALLAADSERGKAAYFDGINDYLRFDNYAGINPAIAISLSTWAKSATATWNSSTSLLSKRNSYLLGPNGTAGMQFWIFIGGTWAQLSVADMGVDITAWHQYTATYDGSNLILYVDGLEVARLAYSGAIAADTGYLYVGLDDGMSRYFNGWLDDVLVFNRALTAAEVQSLVVNTGETSYRHQGLSPNSTFTYRLSASKAAICPWPNDFQERTATTFAPPKPSTLAIDAADTSTLNLSWTDNSGSETSYNLERCPGTGTACDEDAEFSTLNAGLLPDTVSYSDTSVCEGTSYSYRLRAEKADGPIWQTAWEGPVAQTVTAKIAPSALMATQVSEVQINLAWSDSNNDESGFSIERCAGAGCSSFVEIATSAAGSTTYQDDQLAPDTSYSYRLKAFKTATCPWQTAYSNTTSVVTAVIVPSGLTASSINTTQIDLAWTDNAASETATVIERCVGGGCSNFAVHAEVGPNITRYADVDACYGTTYTYRLAAKNDGLSAAGGGCWTRRVPLTFSAFVAYANTEIVVPYDADMRSDFGDVRFYDETGQRELAYGLLAKTDGVSARFMVELGRNQTISLYYGNATATHSGNLDPFIEFQDDFTGTSIDTSKWVEIDPTSSIAQDNDLLFIDTTDGWNKALISQQTFTRAAGKELYLDLTVPADTPGNNHLMLGWELNQTGNPAYSQLVHGLYWNNYGFSTYEKGGNTGGTGSYTASTAYQMKIELKATGAKYFIKGGAYADWTLIKETATYNDATLRIGFHPYSHQLIVHQVKVGEASIAAGAALGAEQTNACYSYGNTWTRGYSNEDEATTTSPVAPSGLTATAISDSRFDLSWTDNTALESGFKIERCSGSGCSNFSQIDTVAGNVTGYTDLSAPASVESSYRVRAFKSSSCPWDSGYSNSAGDLSFPAASTSLVATALGAQMIRLEWDDAATDEDGYQVEVLLPTGRFAKIADLPANSVSFVDTMSLQQETEYTYRIRPYRGADLAPYSAPASATTLSYSDGNGTCPP